MPGVLESGISASLSASFGCVQEGCTRSEPHSPGCSAPRQGRSPVRGFSVPGLPLLAGHLWSLGLGPW